MYKLGIYGTCVVLLVLSAESAVAEMSFGFSLRHTEVHRGGGPEHSWHIVTYVDLPEAISSPANCEEYELGRRGDDFECQEDEFPMFELISPTGHFSSIGHGSGTRFSGDLVDSFVQIQNLVHGEWTFDVTMLDEHDEPRVSRYTISPDLKGLSEKDFLRVESLSPGAGAVFVTPKPTFSWTPPTDSFRQAWVSVRSKDLAVQPGWTTITGQTFYQPAVSLPNRQYWFDLFYRADSVFEIPVEVVLIEGPDLGPASASLGFEYELVSSFTVAVPEPSSAIILILTALLASIRRIGPCSAASRN